MKKDLTKEGEMIERHSHCDFCGELLEDKGCRNCDPRAFGLCEICEIPIEHCICSQEDDEE